MELFELRILDLEGPMLIRRYGDFNALAAMTGANPNDGNIESDLEWRGRGVAVCP